MTARVSDAFPAAGLLADRPADPGVVPGFYAATDTDTLYRWDGTAWGEWLTGSTPTPLGCRATRTTTQSIPYNSSTPIDFTASEWETVEMHDPAVNPSRLTVPAGMDGVWDIKAAAGYASAATADPARSIMLYVNGAFVSDADGHVRMQVPAGSAWPLTFAIDLELAAGDYVQLLAKQIITGGVALNVTAAKISMTYRGPVA